MALGLWGTSVPEHVFQKVFVVQLFFMYCLLIYWRNTQLAETKLQTVSSATSGIYGCLGFIVSNSYCHYFFVAIIIVVITNADSSIITNVVVVVVFVVIAFISPLGDVVVLP